MKTKMFLIGVLALPMLGQAQIASNSATFTSNDFVSVAKEEPRNGVYLNAQEFENNSPEMGFDTKTKTYKLHENLLGKKLILIEGAEKANFPNNSIWGFRKNEEDFRVFANDEYKIEYAPKGQDLIFYSKYVKDGYKGAETELKYYFSRNAQSAIYDLNLENLNAVFSDQIGFINALNKADLDTSKPIQSMKVILAAYISNNVK